MVGNTENALANIIIRNETFPLHFLSWCEVAQICFSTLRKAACEVRQMFVDGNFK